MEEILKMKQILKEKQMEINSLKEKSNVTGVVSWDIWLDNVQCLNAMFAID